jgi:hypothetical protein
LATCMSIQTFSPPNEALHFRLLPLRALPAPDAMVNHPKLSAPTCISFATILFVGGFIAFGSGIAQDARSTALFKILDELKAISDKLPAQKIVEVENIVERPAKYSVLVEKALKERKVTYNKDALGFCKQLMFGRENSNVSVPNLYEAISEWGTTPQANHGLEDKIMAHVMLVLIECFQNT